MKLSLALFAELWEVEPLPGESEMEIELKDAILIVKVQIHEYFHWLRAPVLLQVRVNRYWNSIRSFHNSFWLVRRSIITDSLLAEGNQQVKVTAFLLACLFFRDSACTEVRTVNLHENVKLSLF